MERKTIKKAAIRFCRFSRKNYAMFCSIKKEVTIGFLKAHVVECSLKKNAALVIFDLDKEKLLSFYKDEKEKEEDELKKTLVLSTTKKDFTCSLENNFHILLH